MENATFKKSESIANIAKAVAEFQSKVPAIKKDGTNPHFKSKFATLESIIDGIKKPLQDAKLSYVQMPSGENELVTVLMHESGEFFESTVKMAPKENTPQGQGSAITYMRRYSLSAMLGLATEDDDDGNAATGGAKGAGAKAPAKPQEVGSAMFDKVKKSIEGITDPKMLASTKEKIEKSDKYGEAQKKELVDLISKRESSLKK